MRTPPTLKLLFARCAPRSYAKSLPTDTIVLVEPVGPVTVCTSASKAS